MESLNLRSKSHVALAVGGLVLGIILVWKLIPRDPSAASLLEAAIHSEDAATRQDAALNLIALRNSSNRLDELLAKSNDPAVRAICLQGMGDADAFSAVETLFAALDDPSPLVRSSAAGSLGRLMRCPTHFPYNGQEEERRAAAEIIRQRWERLVRLDLLEELSQATSLAYFYDQHTGELFEAPSQLPDAFELPSGPYQGMPAAVRASVFTTGGPSQRFVAWLSVHDEILRQHAIPLPEPPELEGEATVIRRPNDTAWVYASSRDGMAIQDAVFREARHNSETFIKPCLPGRNH